MVWLALLGLTVWLVVQQNSLGALKREIAQLRTLLAGPVRPPVATGITPAMEAAARIAADTAAAPSTTTRAAPEVIAPEPIAAQAIVASAEPAASVEPALTVTQFAPASPPATPIPAPRLPPAPAPSRATVERWLAENGLAWIGGSALVIGGAFLVGYAAQQSFFTPIMRIVAAAVLGL